MKGIMFTFGLLVISSLSGCVGLDDYMKFPPASTSPHIWFRQGISELHKDEDIKECKNSIEKSLPPLVAGDYSYADKARHVVEYCMLAKGYAFTDALPPNGGVSYCSKTYNGSGPACKSIGR